MARTTSVDVPRVDLIKRLKERVKEIPKAVEEYEKAQKAFEKEVSDWVIKLAKDPANFKEVNTHNWRGYNSVQVTFTSKALKTKPKYKGPEQPSVMGYYLNEAIRNIQNTINILELSKSEFVGVSILNKVSQYL